MLPSLLPHCPQPVASEAEGLTVSQQFSSSSTPTIIHCQHALIEDPKIST